MRPPKSAGFPLAPENRGSLFRLAFLVQKSGTALAPALHRMAARRRGAFQIAWSFIPSSRQIKQMAKLPPALSSAAAVWPCCHMAQVSAVNVEKVLKPPQNPVASNRRRWSDKVGQLSRKPSRRQASPLAASVAHGNRSCQGRNNKNTPKRAALPAPPPRKTRKKEDKTPIAQ